MLTKGAAVFTRLAAVVALILSGLAPAALAAPVLERVVIVQRHGVRPPTSSNAALAKYAEKPWPAWPVGPGELTPHGAETVRLMGTSLRRSWRAAGLLPAGCPRAGEVVVWADGADQRTRRSGEILAEALAPGCGVKAAWAAPTPRDPIFNGDRSTAACRSDPAAARDALVSAIGPGGIETPATRSALKRLQAILAPTACTGGGGTCFSGPDQVLPGARLEGPVATAASLPEDLLLEYAEGMPVAQVGWGKAGTAAEVAAVMAVHERSFQIYGADRYATGRDGALMARLILAALAGEPAAKAPSFGPRTRLLALAGHDSNLIVVGSLFGLAWTLPGEPDASAPATTLAFELWTDRGARFVRPVIYYETLDQLRTLAPAGARRQAVTFAGCASGPMGSCPLSEVRRRVLALIPPGCGET